MKSLRIAVIGAGLSGISAATALTERGHSATLFDKSRGSGGRLSSRRTDYGEIDMGAQYFTARDASFRQAVQRWQAAGHTAQWTPRLFRYDEGGLHESPDDQQRFVGVPRMTAISRALLDGLELRSGTRIVELRQGAEAAWTLVDDGGNKHVGFDRVIVATPAPQAVALLHHSPKLAAAAAEVQMDPCWTVVASFAEPLRAEVDACFVRSGPLDWISRHLSKPERSGADSWVLQSSPDWAREHIDAPAEEVTDKLIAALGEVLGSTLPEASDRIAHRWLYARSSKSCDWGALAAPELGLYACGDWCLSGRIEGAWLSGQQAAASVA